ncbi:MAG: hypothetical protein A3C02_04885 [Candidatus Andersenbacteria bacterium RIFCSPHIGHO2_02_FULL_45_11]|uniref:Uncharacterized protein n=1 Tax=Candidatus Andersenbacteria bacterium RIFCSPHIGHO2_12_FULL_45_11 TaxID=1797281 RepID=A0A1G1X2P0_9BACT|nr:MAG: hypothetical protein A2805_02440 [Candidatus Andersenbacteria bacterium RIFCSPHIGHO2_01_FULL_46_36]OGY32876.1 MAG: hypothetical protein A3C02_04885 [Candidatus Andersenbacteria bacterium RIFCSPHIGHO2_02_FULL_45_11]OGY34051.1 MAG: hypothetical protein A3D99_02230 [Candidatus Andersenbacteria bacterium RIFCSPHIGHO2_12_FULL_45_11]
MADKPRSKFAQILAADPALAARCEEVVKQLREAAREDIEAGERAQMIGPKDNVRFTNRAGDDLFS